MATTTPSITNAQALSALLEWAEANGWDAPEMSEKLEKHLVALEKAAMRSSGPSKAARENAVLVEAVASHLANSGEAMGVKDIAQWITDNREEIAVCSVQKATAIATAGVKAGKFTRITDGKKIVFASAEAA